LSDPQDRRRGVFLASWSKKKGGRGGRNARVVHGSEKKEGKKQDEKAFAVRTNVSTTRIREKVRLYHKSGGSPRSSAGRSVKSLKPGKWGSSMSA